ncbi:hypothetical protein HMPREF0682_1558 [Propionibacterium acidifaciens F0233]|uniref:Uncharacterized protein n=1 Tax=Propionibacterium acidifaciens F0233 TaxID=553198 RepID=U2QU06_9ACTN|nr:hypothetical protein HMPREF0682_1558 [Propionibacterium acidifaciens F0233]
MTTAPRPPDGSGRGGAAVGGGARRAPPRVRDGPAMDRPRSPSSVPSSVVAGPSRPSRGPAGPSGS